MKYACAEKSKSWIQFRLLECGHVCTYVVYFSANNIVQTKSNSLWLNNYLNRFRFRLIRIALGQLNFRHISSSSSRMGKRDIEIAFTVASVTVPIHRNALRSKSPISFSETLQFLMNRPLSKTQPIDWFVFGTMHTHTWTHMDILRSLFSLHPPITFTFSQLPHLPVALPISISALIMYESNVNWL